MFNNGVRRRIRSPATGTAVRPAVRETLGPERSSGSSSITTSTYSGREVGNTDANVEITFLR